MSRVNDAFHRADKSSLLQPPAPDAPGGTDGAAAPAPARLNGNARTAEASDRKEAHSSANGVLQSGIGREMLGEVTVVPYQPAPESHLLSLENSAETPAEEFRTLRTRLNHLQTLQPLHTVIITSPSPAEGKTLTASNLALAQSQISEHSVLLADFDLRRPAVHTLLQLERSPGLTDYLSGNCSFPQALRRIEGLGLYVLPAGSPVKNPLEILNLRQVKQLFEELPRAFDWAIFDTPPLLFSADANLLATLADGTVLVVKIGATTFDAVTRAMQSLCENNVLGIVANGARASELYSKYTYYYSKND